MLLFYIVQFILNLMLSIKWSSNGLFNLFLKIVFVIMTMLDALIIAKMLNISQLLLAF